MKIKEWHIEAFLMVLFLSAVLTLTFKLMKAQEKADKLFIQKLKLKQISNEK